MLITKAQRININLLHVFGIVVIGLILTIPVLSQGVFLSDDLLPFHLKWSKNFSEQLWGGDLYPRWLQGMNAGLGSPTFFFYAPVPYYFTSLFHPFFANDPQGWFQLKFSASFALIASGITAYIWLKTITNQNSAFISSLIYMALPYHLSVDLYRRFAFAEYWSFVWMPLILYFSVKIITGNKINIIGFAVSFALLIMTHVITLIMFFIVPSGYIIVMAGRRRRKKALVRTGLALILAIGLSAIYWLPAMATQEYISMKEIMGISYFYGKHFLFLNQPSYYAQNLWKYLEVMTLLMGGLACCAFIIARTNLITTSRQESNYWFFIAMMALFMTLPVSRPLWDVLTAVQKVQFSWRFNSILVVATTALIALVISSLKPSKRIVSFLDKITIGFLLSTSLILAVLQLLPVPKMQQTFHISWLINTVLTALIVVIIALGISYLKKPINFSNQKPLVIGILLLLSLILASMPKVVEKSLYSQSDVDTVLAISRDAHEYRPRWVPSEMFKSAPDSVSPGILETDPISKLGRDSPKASVTVGQGSLLIERWKPREIVLQANAITDIWLTIKQFYYPGWTARINGESHLLPVKPSEAEGLLSVGVPTGKHEVIVALDAGVEERMGQIITAVSALIALLFMLWFYKTNQNNVETL